MTPRTEFFSIMQTSRKWESKGFIKQLYNSKLNSADEKEVFIGK